MTYLRWLRYQIEMSDIVNYETVELWSGVFDNFLFGG